MTAAVLSIGTELTRGEIINTNASWLADTLTGLGLEVAAVDTVDDDEDRMAAAFRRLGADHRLVVVTGGLGPTTDDITRDVAATASGVGLIHDAMSMHHIEALFRKAGRTVAASNRRQALFPEGARVLANPVGTAPGFVQRIGEAEFVFLPGVPGEMKTMALAHLPELTGSLIDVAVIQRRINTFGMPESAVNDRLAGIETAHDVLIGYRAHFPEIIVKVQGRDADPARAQRKVDGAVNVVIERLGDDTVFAEGNVSFPQAVGNLLTNRRLTLACAESCTGGLVGSLLTDAAGASSFFLGSAVTYANTAKERILSVPRELLEAHGAVSEPVACAMASGARQLHDADVAVAITGIAGPGGGSDTKPVGLVHFAVATPHRVVAYHDVMRGDRERIRRRAAFTALDVVRRVVRERPLPEPIRRA